SSTRRVLCRRPPCDSVRRAPSGFAARAAVRSGRFLPNTLARQSLPQTEGGSPMRCSIRVTTGVALLALWALCASSAMAQDPVKVAPDMYKVRLDNARVRVLEVTGKAGQKAALHKHPGYVVYDLSDGK